MANSLLTAKDLDRKPADPIQQLPRLPAGLTPANLPGMGVMELPVTKPAILPTAKIPSPPTATPPPATQYDSLVLNIAQMSTFCKLPESVRNKIYRLTLLSPKPIYVKRRPFPAEPNLLFTCKQIRKEAQLLFWTENIFQGRDAVYVCTSRTRPPQVLYQRQLSVLLEWLDRIGKAKAGLIKKLVLDYDEDCQFNGHPSYQSNWPATAGDVVMHTKTDLAAAARFSAIKVLRGLLFHGIGLDVVQPVPILKGMSRDGRSDQFGAFWKLAMEDVVATLRVTK